MRSLIPFLILLLSLSAHSQPPHEDANPLHLPNDAVSLLAFKAKADLDHNLFFTSHFHHCQWPGVTCRRRRVVRFSVISLGLRGSFAGDTLTRLDQLRVLVLRNNSLSGRLPDLSLLSNLRTLLLDHNSFSGSFPFVFSLYKLRFLDLSFNNFSGEIPDGIIQLDRLNYLNLQFNRFNGSVPPLNQSDLQFFNVSGNYLSGNIPAASAISKFPSSSFRLNPNLCGEIISKPCDSVTSSATNQRPPIPSNSEPIISPPSQSSLHKREAIVLGLSLGALFLTSSLMCVFLAGRKQRNKNAVVSGDSDAPASETTETEVVRVRLDSQSKELNEKCKELVEGKAGRRENNNLVFCYGEEKLYTLEQLLKATAEMLGTGTIGTTYKAKMDDELIVTVKRLDGIRMSGVNGEMFERHMDVLGTLRHPNLVPLRAYFQAKEERLIIYDYQPNGSVFNLIHGSRSTRAKPLHWTSCLKIAEDVAQGLCYIHQVAKLVHGNLKASNVLLGTDFEACVTDYSLLIHTVQNGDSECDIYDFGVLLLELLSGKPPSEHPLLAAPELPRWVKAMREKEDDDVFKDTQLRMLIEVVSLCSFTYPKQRPAMWQVLKMIQKIKAMA